MSLWARLLLMMSFSFDVIRFFLIFIELYLKIVSNGALIRYKRKFLKIDIKV